MNGLVLSKSLYSKEGKNIINAEFSNYKKYMAIGLVGEGSECFGFDDEVSKDHDFAAEFCIWLPDKIYNEIGLDLQKKYNEINRKYNKGSLFTKEGKGRRGVLSLENFYTRYLGVPCEPKDNLKWFKIPEHFLATATNGEVFMDEFGEFSRIRNNLKMFYPKDVMLKKLAGYCSLMAQSGQYNFNRSLKRNDLTACYLSCGLFVENAMSAIYLLNKEYKPFYKWAFRGAEKLPRLVRAINGLKEICLLGGDVVSQKRKAELIEMVALNIVDELKLNSFTESDSDFLGVHGEELMKKIEDENLKKMHIMVTA